MRYMFLVYTNEQAREAMSPQERAGLIGEHQPVMDEARRRGIFCGADPLEPTATATTVRVQSSKILITDGPFAETKEQLAGYYILECKDLDEALEWAARIPSACGDGTGCIEVRPIRGMAGREEQRAVAPQRASG
jgi:hypothetical protein